MAASKSGFMKDALILFAITLVSGLCLGVVYDVTKAPIEAATIAANNATYKQVLPEAESFDDVEGSTEKIAETADEIANLGFGGVAIESVLEAKDASGEVVGHVINSLSNDSYGGAVKLSIGFDADTRSFGSKADTLYNARRAGKSVSFPRVSPDGKFLMFTLSAYGNFSIWHKDADLYLAHLHTNQIRPLSALNSNDVESYHSWSSNSRWVVFSSRRTDGLYTRPFIAYIDEKGKAHKPFLLPQKEKDHYTFLMKSYNIPEFISGKVNTSAYDISRTARKEKGTDVVYSLQ